MCKLKKLSNTKKESAGKDDDGQPDFETAVNGVDGMADANGATVEAPSPAVSGKKRPIKRKGLHCKDLHAVQYAASAQVERRTAIASHRLIADGSCFTTAHYPHSTCSH